MKVAFRTVWFQIPIFRGLGGSSMKKLTLGDVCKKESSHIAQKDIMECEGEYPIYGAGGFIKNVNKNEKIWMIGICVISVLVAPVGFSNLVSLLYPIFGILGLIQIWGILKVEYL